MRIARYLKCTSKFGMFYQVNLNRGIEVYVDADFPGSWSNETALDPNYVLSRTGYVILLFGCPLFWHSKLQTEIALSTTEAKYIALSQSLWNGIPLLNLINELIPALDIEPITPLIKCKVFEDNQSTIAVAKAPSMLPRTKHIGLKYHYFWQFVQRGIIDISYVNTDNQIADLLTKPLAAAAFSYLRHKLISW